MFSGISHFESRLSEVIATSFLGYNRVWPLNSVMLDRQSMDSHWVTPICHKDSISMINDYQDEKLSILSTGLCYFEKYAVFPQDKNKH